MLLRYQIRESGLLSVLAQQLTNQTDKVESRIQAIVDNNISTTKQ